MPPSNRSVPEARSVHLCLGLTAAAAAFALPRGSAWRVPAAAFAAVEIGYALRRVPIPAHVGGGREAPELVRSAVVNGTLMRWEEHGEPREGIIPVVMVHGIPTSPRAWRYVIPHLIHEGVCCLAWEQVGFGWSMAAGLGRDISIPRQAAYLRAWLRHRGIRQAIFVGHDVGGGILQHFATAHPEMVLALVLTDCVAYDNWPVAAVRTARAMRDLVARLPPALVKPFFLAALRNLGHDNPLRGAEAAALHWEPYARSIGPTALAHQLHHLKNRDTLAVAPALRHLDVPARIVWGERDPLGMWSAEQLAADLRAPLRRIPGGQHFTLEDHPDEIAQVIREVLPEARAALKHPATSGLP